MSLFAGETLERFQPHFELLFGSNGDLIGIQNPRANGADLRFSSDGTETIGTLNVTSSLNLYNTTPISSTNYERLRLDWSSNVARVWTGNDGTGAARALRVGVGFTDGVTAPINYTQWGIVNPGISHVFAAGASTGIWHELASLTASASSGTQTAVAVSPTFAQTSTAAGIALLVNPSGTFGSGGGLLQEWQLAGVRRALIDSSGQIYGSNIYAAGQIGMAASMGATNDVTLNRDAADTLALRRTTNAQIFRVYNTYTDASNNERLDIRWSANDLFIQTDQVGTGVTRNMVIGPVGASSLVLRTMAASRWILNSAGHLLAATDNTYDIGASGATRPRNVYVADSVTAVLVRTTALTVATLPAAVAGNAGMRGYVTDANATTFLSIVAGGGANTVPVISNGTNWLIG